MAQLNIFVVSLFLAAVLNLVQCSDNRFIKSSIVSDLSGFSKENDEVTLQSSVENTPTSNPSSRNIQKIYKIGHRITGKIQYLVFLFMQIFILMIREPILSNNFCLIHWFRRLAHGSGLQRSTMVSTTKCHCRNTVSKIGRHWSNIAKYHLCRNCMETGEIGFFPLIHFCFLATNIFEEKWKNKIISQNVHAFQSTDFAQTRIISGGIGHQFISIGIEAPQTLHFSYKAQIYGYSDDD